MDALTKHIATAAERIVGPYVVGPTVIHHLHGDDEWLGNEFFCLANHVVVTHLKRSHQGDAVLVICLPNSDTLFYLEGERLFDQNMLTCFCGTNTKLCMRIVVSTDINNLDRIITEDAL